MNKFLEKVNEIFNIYLEGNIKEKDFSRKAIIIIISIILCFNISLYFATEYAKFPGWLQKRELTSGFSHDYAQHFVYFFYYKNQFPLATLDEDIEYSENYADYLIHEKGENLIMEYEHWSRLGENARIFAYIPNAFLKASPKNPSIKLFNLLVFTLALIVCFLGFSLINMPRFGLILIGIVNLTPFFIYEVYERENIFWLLAAVFLIIIGLNIKLLFNKKINHLIYSIPIISGVIVGFFSEIRSEILIIAVSVILIYIISKSVKIFSKIILIILLVFSFMITKKIIRNYFENKFNESYALVKENNGHTYDGVRIGTHRFWHPVFCGLGDFDKKYGYEWNDKVAYRYAIPILKEKYNIDIKYSEEFHTDDYYDEAKLYYVKFDDIPEYELIVKDKVIGDITSNPFWYLTIIFKRVIRILTQTIPIPFLGWVMFILAYLLYKKKNWNFLKLLFISLPLSFTSLFIFSGGYSNYNSFYSVITFTVIVYTIYIYRKQKEVLSVN